MSAPIDKLDVALKLHDKGNLAEAERIYREILAQEPNHPDALHLLGLVAHQTGHHEQAVSLIGRAIRLRSGVALYYNNLGQSLRNLTRFDDARAAFSQAIAINPNFAEAYCNMATICQLVGEFREALVWCERALAIDAEHVNTHYNRALSWLALGDFPRGWAEYEWRWQREEFRRALDTMPEWDGSPLEGRRLFVRSEQGLGDTLQYVRFISVLQEMGASLELAIPPSLAPLLLQSGIRPFATDDTQAAPYDVHTTLVSLPNRLGTTLETIPAQVPYLFADEARVALWRERMQRIAGFRVGIAWQGNPKFPQDRWRSIPLGEFAPLAQVAGVRLFCLQKNHGLEQLEQLGGAFQVVDLRPEYDVEEGAFLNAAAIMRNLDLVITTDTALAHLAGALGVRVWVLLGIGADFRWLSGRSDSPWYPTMRLFRQARLGDWTELLNRVAGELAAEVNSRRQPG
jgi:Flp pilus assembly protein TadD